MNAVKILIILFLILSFIRLLRFEKRKTINLSAFIFWSAVLFGSITLFVQPNISENIAHILGIGRGVDSIFFLAILLNFYLNFQLYLRIQKLDRNITNITINTSKRLHILEQKMKKESDMPL